MIKLVDRYGDKVVASVMEMIVNNIAYGKIRKKTLVTLDDIKLINIIQNNGILGSELNSDEVKEYYLKVKSLKKTGKHYGYGVETIKRVIDYYNIPKFRKNKSQSVIEWRRKRKQDLVEYKGGKCVCCGYNKSYSSLDFHHVDPKEKDFTISGSSYSFDKLKTEVDKCMLVCSNCHGEIHEEIRESGESELVNKYIKK